MTLDPYALKIFIDGSALKNPGGPGGIAGVAQYPDSWNKADECIFEIGYLATTNNRMELRALLEALDHTREHYRGRQAL
jgi:ribonuclease HI